MALLTTKTIPPGGWIYEQRDQSGKVIKKFATMSPFRDACITIINFRKVNGLPGADGPTVAADLDEATCQRLGNDELFCGSKKNSRTDRPSLWSKLVQRAEAVARGVGQLNSGRQILSDWLGSGSEPVHQFTAQYRADICTGRRDGNICKFNKPGLKPVARAAEIIKSHVEIKNAIELSVEGEENLHTCEICFCHLPLKVHVPLDTILDKTPAHTLKKFEELKPECWMNKRHIDVTKNYVLSTTDSPARFDYKPATT